MTVRVVYTGGEFYEFDPAGPAGPADQDHPAGPLRGESPDTDLHLTLLAAALCNNCRVEGEAGTRLRLRRAGPCFSGDPTEVALLVAAQRAGIGPDIAARWPRFSEVPFEPERRMMSVVCGAPSGGRCVFAKGAPERLLQLCTGIVAGGKVRPLTPGDRENLLQVSERLAGDALRVLAVAYRELPDGGVGDERDGGAGDGDPERDLTFLGLVGMYDPPRPEVIRAMERCHTAGLRVVMVTGDHASTARAVAAEIGLLAGRDARLVTGDYIEAMDDDRLGREVEGIAVYARVSPTHKLRIVRALKERGHVVAMTGDGVNDAPALKEADIGVAMGLTGTEVAKEAAAIVLTDDNFASIVAAVEEGRTIYDNIRKFVRYLLGCNTGEVMVMFLATLLGLPLPLLPIHILLVNLVTDGLPAVALGVDPPASDLMRRPPRNPREGVFSGGLWRKIVSRGTWIGLATLAAFTYSLWLGADLARSRTVAMAVLSCAQLVYAFECRSESASLLRVGFTGNRALLVAVAASLAVLAAVIHLPLLQALFHTVPLSAPEWFGVVLAALAGSAFALLRRLN